jgi:hypothetical protein
MVTCVDNPQLEASELRVGTEKVVPCRWFTGGPVGCRAQLLPTAERISMSLMSGGPGLTLIKPKCR